MAEEPNYLPKLNQLLDQLFNLGILELLETEFSRFTRSPDQNVIWPLMTELTEIFQKFNLMHSLLNSLQEGNSENAASSSFNTLEVEYSNLKNRITILEKAKNHLCATIRCTETGEDVPWRLTGDINFNDFEEYSEVIKRMQDNLDAFARSTGRQVSQSTYFIENNNSTEFHKNDNNQSHSNNLNPCEVTDQLILPVAKNVCRDQELKNNFCKNFELHSKNIFETRGKSESIKEV